MVRAEKARKVCEYVTGLDFGGECGAALRVV